MKLKVFGGHIFINGKPRHAVVATTSQKKAAEAFDVPLSHFRNYFCETGNDAERVTACRASFSIAKMSFTTNASSAG